MNCSTKASLNVAFVGEIKLSRTQEKLTQNLWMHKGGGCGLTVLWANERDVKLKFSFAFFFVPSTCSRPKIWQYTGNLNK